MGQSECCLTGCLLGTVTVVVEMVLGKENALSGSLVRGWRRWGSAAGGYLPECLELVLSGLGNLKTASFLSLGDKEYLYTQPQARVPALLPNPQ